MAEKSAPQVGDVCRFFDDFADASPALAIASSSEDTLQFVPCDKNCALEHLSSDHWVRVASFVRSKSDVACVLGRRLHCAHAIAMRRRSSLAFEAFREANWRPPNGGLDSEKTETGPKVEQGMILCAGLGTRLRPLTAHFPKPAVPFFGAPLVRYAMASLRKAGVEHLVVNTHHLPELMEKVARQEAERAEFGSIHVSHEPVLMDTAGGLREARRLMKDGPLLVVNGDAFMALDLKAFCARHFASGACASLAVAPPVPGAHFRAIEADRTGSIWKIRGKGPDKLDLSSWHFLGVHLVEEEVFRWIPTKGSRDINGEVYPAMIASGKNICALPVPVGAWADLGTPERYYDACMEVISGGADVSALGNDSPLSFGKIFSADSSANGGAQREPSFVCDGAHVSESADLVASVIQPGARVGDHAQVIRSVLLPGAIVPSEATLMDTILWPDGAMSIG